jgi:hypothetical protein
MKFPPIFNVTPAGVAAAVYGNNLPFEAMVKLVTTDMAFAVAFHCSILVVPTPPCPIVKLLTVTAALTVTIAPSAMVTFEA